MPSVYTREASLTMIRLAKEVPALPDRFARIQAVLDREDSSFDELAEVIGTDQSTTAMVLKAANSAYYNRTGTPVTDLQQAISRLGLRETGQIAMSMSLCYGFAIPMGMGNIRAFWAHAFAVGLLSKQMGQMLGENSDELFVAGLLHDIGRAILGILVDMDYFESPLAQMDGSELVEAEHERYGIDHAEAGAELLKLWHFPERLQKIVGGHHSLDESDFLPARICALANNEAHARLPYGTTIDRVGEVIMDDFKADAPDLIKEASLA